MINSAKVQNSSYLLEGQKDQLTIGRKLTRYEITHTTEESVYKARAFPFPIRSLMLGKCDANLTMV